jgi:hypothetical protein
VAGQMITGSVPVPPVSPGALGPSPFGNKPFGRHPWLWAMYWLARAGLPCVSGPTLCAPSPRPDGAPRGQRQIGPPA